MGNQLYKETTFSTSTSRKIKNVLTVGLLFNVYQLTIKNYGNTTSFGISSSLTYNINPDINWSLLYHNLNTPRIGISKEYLPQVIATGFTYSPSDHLLSMVEVEKDLQFEPRFKFGVLFKPLKQVQVSTGFINHPTQITGAFLITLFNQEVSYAFATHPHLSLSHTIGFHFILR
jgi:hypothetical protein